MQGLFNEKRAIPTMASLRVQRWALTLAAYDYHIVYKPDMANANADALSHLPCALIGPDAPFPGEVILNGHDGEFTDDPYTCIANDRQGPSAFMRS